MSKIKLSQIILVEGKYDAIKLDSFIDGLIIPLNGFSIFTDQEKKDLIKNLGEENGIILVTDSDTAGFKIRNYIQNICKDAEIFNVYIPNIQGKESRKHSPSKEGFLGVEGVSKQILLDCFEKAGISGTKYINHRSSMDYADLYDLGLSGTPSATLKRKVLCDKLNIPTKLSKKAFLEVLNRITTIEEIENILYKKVICWDFHGTLTKPDNQWIDAAIKLCEEHYADFEISSEKITTNLSGQCLPWWTYPDRDTRHLIENDGWWLSCKDEFVKMYINSGLDYEQANKIAPLIRDYVVDYKNHHLYEDTKNILKSLKDKGYTNIMLSNNFPELEDIVCKLGIRDLFDHIIVSANVGYDKPRKEIFDYAKNLAGSYEEIYMVGDNPVDDMKGAKSCGFTTILVNASHKNYKEQDVDFVCNNLNDILKVL